MRSPGIAAQYVRRNYRNIARIHQLKDGSNDPICIYPSLVTAQAGDSIFLAE